MTRSRKMQVKAIVVLLLGYLALTAQPTAAAAATTSTYCFETCIDAVWYLNCERIVGAYTACDYYSYNCPQEAPVEGYCAWDT